MKLNQTLGIDFDASWHGAATLKNRNPKHVAKMFFKERTAHHRSCISQNGVIEDQGGEFISDMNGLFEQHGVTEKHGGLLDTMWRKLISECDRRGLWIAGICLQATSNAKNSTMTHWSRISWTEEQSGICRRYTKKLSMSVLGNDGKAWKASHIRAATKAKLLRNDALDIVRRVMFKQAPTVSWWSPNLTQGRKQERWRGPASKPDAKLKVKKRVKRVFLKNETPEKKAQTTAQKTELQPEASRAIKDVTGERLHPLRKIYELTMYCEEVVFPSDERSSKRTQQEDAAGGRSITTDIRSRRKQQEDKD